MAGRSTLLTLKRAACALCVAAASLPAAGAHIEGERAAASCRELYVDTLRRFGPADLPGDMPALAAVGFMRVGKRWLAVGGSKFTPALLFANGEGGAHFETYDPQSLLRRRNQLTYSSQFSNAAWTRTNILSVTENADGVGDLVIADTAAGVHRIYQNSVASIGSTSTITVRAKAGGYNFIGLRIGSLTSVVYFNLATGSVGTNASGFPATISPAPDAPGYYDCTATEVPDGVLAVVYVCSGDNVNSFSGDGTSGIYLARAQLEWNTTTPSAYQEVTNWNTEYLAAAGSANVGMWQDSAGTIPVTAVEQPVGKWIDKSGRGNHATQSGSTKRPMLSARVNLLTKTEQFDDAAWSSVNAGTGVLPVVTANYGTAPDGSQTAARIQFDKGAGTTTGDYSGWQQTIVLSSPARLGVWLKTRDGSSKQIALRCNGYKILNVTGLWQWFTYDEPSGVGQWQLILRGTYGTSDSADLLVWHPDSRTADDAAKNIPAYQRVNTTTDYDTVGFPHRLRFDKLDDCLQVPTLDLSAFSKATVWLGVTKSTEALGIICELNTSSAIDGSFYAAAYTAAQYQFGLRGTLAGMSVTAPTNAAPTSDVVTVQYDTAAPLIQPYVDGAAKTPATAGTSPGNFAASSFNIGGRNNGASLVLDGYIQSVTVQASSTPTSKAFIDRMNRYAANLMAITI